MRPRDLIHNVLFWGVVILIGLAIFLFSVWCNDGMIFY